METWLAAGFPSNIYLMGEIEMKPIEIYHGSNTAVEFPEVRKTRYTKDFSWGFYCTKSYEQAYRWANRRNEAGVVNIYFYVENESLKILKFEEMTDEWLDFIIEKFLGFRFAKLFKLTKKSLFCLLTGRLD